MKDITKYQGVIPAFYACYDAEGNISTEGVKALTRHLIAKGVKGVYVGGSSGECIYQHVDERKAVLEAVMSEAKGKLTVIAHVGCNNTADSVELARHAESVGVDAIASIPPIYFHLPEYAIAKYWNDMSAAAPNTEFVIYNIPQLAGTGLTMSLLKEMLKNPTWWLSRTAPCPPRTSRCSRMPVSLPAAKATLWSLTAPMSSSSPAASSVQTAASAAPTP